MVRPAAPPGPPGPNHLVVRSLEIKRRTLNAPAGGLRLGGAHGLANVLPRRPNSLYDPPPSA